MIICIISHAVDINTDIGNNVYSLFSILLLLIMTLVRFKNNFLTKLSIKQRPFHSLLPYLHRPINDKTIYLPVNTKYLYITTKSVITIYTRYSC